MRTIGAMGEALLSRLRGRIEGLLGRAQTMEGTIECSFTLNADFRFVRVSRKAEQLVKRSRAELLGKSIWELFPGVVGSAREREYRRALGARSSVRFEEYAPHVDAWFEVHACASPTGLQVCLTDVTPRKRAEQDLATRLGQQAAVAALGQHALSAADLQTVFEEAVRAVASGLRVELTKVLELAPDGESLSIRAGVGWKEDAQTVVGADLMSQAGYTLLNKGPVIVEDLRTELRFRGPQLLIDHEVVSGMSVVIAGAERPFGVLGAHTKRSRRFTVDDVNFLQAVANVIALAVQRRCVMQELIQSEARFRLLAETVHDAFFIADRETWRSEYVSPAYEAIWGRPYDPLGPSWLETVHPDDRAALERELAGRPFGRSYEYRIVRADGAVRWVASQMFPVRVADASDRRVVWVARDVTARREAEEVARRLQEERLARATVEAGLRARDDVLALVSHDLRNPLNTIAVTTELLARSTNDPAVVSRAGAIGRAAARMSRLVEDLLDVARIEAGKMNLRIEPIDLAALLSEVGEAVEAQGAAKRIRLTIESAPGLPLVRGDRDRILRVILNLVGNAIKFTSANGRVSVRAERDGDRVLVAVSDSGPGIPEHARTHLFRPFWQAQSSDPRGAGLGLSIVRGIIDAHGERIWVTDAEGGGATFAFSLAVESESPAASAFESRARALPRE